MIKIVHARWVKEKVIRFVFSDASEGEYDFSPLLTHETSLTQTLREEREFKRFFLELGALCWSNGLEFSADKLHRDLQEANRLHQTAKAA